MHGILTQAKLKWGNKVVKTLFQIVSLHLNIKNVKNDTIVK